MRYLVVLLLSLVFSESMAVAQSNDATETNTEIVRPVRYWQSVNAPGLFPMINLDLGAAGLSLAGDINGDSLSDYVYGQALVQDERTADLSDRIGKTIVFFGGNFELEADQVVYSRLYPAGDLNGDGFDDALAFDGLTQQAFYFGSADGYVLSNVAPPALSLDNVVGFHDLDGDRYEDVVLFSDDQGDITVVWGAADAAAITSETFTLPFDEALQLAVVDIEADTTAELVVLDGPRFSDEVELSIYRFDAGRSVQEAQRLSYPSFDGRVENAILMGTDVDNDGVRELVIDNPSDRTVDFFFQNDPATEGLFEPNPLRLNVSNLRYAGDVNDDTADDFFLNADLGSVLIHFGPLLNESGDPLFDNSIRIVNENETGIAPFTARAGDLTGDGIDDVLLRLARPEASGRRILQGRNDGNLNAIDVLYSRQDFPEDQVPYTANVGDLNGDGLEDFAFVHQSNEPEANRVEVFFGRATLPDTPDLVFQHEDRLTPTAAETGDFNGDQEPDLAISFQGEVIPFPRKVNGGVQVYLGGDPFDTQADYVLTYEDLNPSQDLSGSSVRVNAANAGDVNLDGIDDLLIALPTGAGENILLVLGAASLPPAPNLSFTQIGRSGTLGSSITGLGDLNGDGADDFALNDGFQGKIYVHFGDSVAAELITADLVLEPPTEEGKRWFLYGVGITAGDYNGDGWRDLAAQVAIHSTTDMSDGVEAIFIYYGGPTLDAVADVRLPLPKRYFGLDEPGLLDYSIGELSFLPDLNGDGFQELLFGSFEANPVRGIGPTPDAFIWPGGATPDGTPLFTLEASNRLAGLGADLNNIYASQGRSAIGDFNGNGRLDVILPQARDNNDGVFSSRIYHYELDLRTTPVEQPEPLPDGLALEQNYPNPFSGQTTIAYYLAKTTYVRLTVYDMLGRVVARLAEGMHHAGQHVIHFDARALKSGVYFYRLETNGEQKGKKLIITN